MVDGNCHPFTVAPQAFDPSRISLDIHPDPDRPQRLVEIGPNRAMQELLVERLASWLGCDHDDVAAVRAERASRDWPGYVASLFRDAGLSDLVMDASYPPGAADSISTFAALSGCRVFPTKRIDTELDEGIVAGGSAREIWQHVHDAMVRAAPTVVAFKSIIAYRTGLSVDPDAAENSANAALASTALPRRRAKACRDWILRQALGLAADLNRPVQIHTGLGDSDLRLGEADPILLEPLLATPEARACQIVLIHASYPWHENLATLVSAHERVWADLSMTNLYSPVTFAARLQRLLELAPDTRLMLGTDGHQEPEIFWFGAKVVKAAWAVVDSRLQRAGLRPSRLQLIKQSMFETNARALYGI